MFCANIYGPPKGDGYATTLSLEVFTQRTFVADFSRSKLNFIKNNTKCFSSQPLG